VLVLGVLSAVLVPGVLLSIVLLAIIGAGRIFWVYLGASRAHNLLVMGLLWSGEGQREIYKIEYMLIVTTHLVRGKER
jgi:hypothetical protein